MTFQLHTANPVWEQGTRGHLACGDRKRRNKTWVPKGTLLKSWGQGDSICSHKSRAGGTDSGSPSWSRGAQQGLLSLPMFLFSRQAGAQHAVCCCWCFPSRALKPGSHSVAQAKPNLTAVLLLQTPEGLGLQESIRHVQFCLVLQQVLSFCLPVFNQALQEMNEAYSFSQRTCSLEWEMGLKQGSDVLRKIEANAGSKGCSLRSWEGGLVPPDIK